jgi:hypothetical protein
MNTDLKALKEIVEARMQILRSLPHNKYPHSDCHGTAVWLLGAENTELPRFVSREEMAGFLENRCFPVEAPRETDIATIWTKLHKENLKGPEILCLQHSGIVVHPETQRIYHQRDTLEDYEFSSVEEYITSNFPRRCRVGVHIFPKFYRFQG